MKFNNIPLNERPRERLKKLGVNYLTNEELLAIILKTGYKNKTVKELSLELLCTIDDLKSLKNISYNNLIKIKGIGEVKALEILAVVELGKRIYCNEVMIKRYNINKPIELVNYFKNIFKEIKHEEFHVVFLDQNNNIITHKLLFMGTVNMSICHPREIFKEAYLNSASKIICIHNHPSGNVFPSNNDIIITRKIKEIGYIHDIKLIDHIIMSNDNYYSFNENNFFKK